MPSDVRDAVTVDRAIAYPNPWLAVYTLSSREWVRFVRQGNRVFGAIGQPVLFWLLFSAGLGPSFRLPGSGASSIGYREYFFPGTLVLILLFTAIFATISIIEDRREGFLQSVLVAPLPRWSLVLGKILGAALIALAQGLLFLLLGLTVGFRFSLVSFLEIAAFSFLVAFALTSLGFLIAWRLDSTQGFHAIMSVFLLPMWLLSGAFFPADPRASTGSAILAWFIDINPLTYGVAGLRRLLHEGQRDILLPGGLPSFGVCLLVTIAFAAIAFTLSCVVAGTRTTGDLQ